MLRRTNRGTLQDSFRLRGWSGALVAVLMAVAGIGTFAPRADSGDGSGTIALTAPAGCCISIARPSPERHPRIPAFPGEALTETERASEDTEQAGASNYSWPAGVGACLFSARFSRTPAPRNACDARSDSVDLTVLCRLLI